MNAILKFKQRKMIPKAQGGLRFVEAGNTTMGNKVWADATTGDLYESNINPNDSKYINNFRPGIKGHLGKSYNFYNLFSGRGTINGADYVRKSAAPKDYSFMKGNTRLRTADEEAKLKDPAIQKYLNRQQGPVTQPNAPTAVSPKRTPINWGNKFNNFMGGLSAEQQKWLEDNGLNDATKLQDYLTNMGFSVGKFGSDGKFGNDSRAAWDKFAASGIMGKNRDQEIYEEKLKELVLDAEDPFGYRTDNHYGDGAALKNMGFSNYAGLQKFAVGDDQFAKDLRQRFGQDVSKWDQAAVEGALGVSGRYRGSRGGDFGDMARSMQQWAAQQNAAYDTKEQASRTDSSGTVYSNSKLAQLFDKAGKSVEANKFKLLTPAMNFNLKQGNIGAATLGNILTLDPSNMSPRERFAMGIE